MVTGILNLILIPLAILVLAWVSWSQSDVPGARSSYLPVLLLVITPLLLCGFMIFAGVKMWGLQARTAVLAASVLAMIVVPGNIIGLPLGVWALVTLSRREVRAAVLRTPVRPQGGEYFLRRSYWR